MFLINEFGEYLLNSRGHALMFPINEFGEYLLLFETNEFCV